MLATGIRLGVFEILAPLGKGGMGEVYRAKDTKLEREVASRRHEQAGKADGKRPAEEDRMERMWSLVSCARSSLTETSDSGEYFIGRFGPHEGLRALVVDLNVTLEIPFKPPDAFVS